MLRFISLLLFMIFFNMVAFSGPDVIKKPSTTSGENENFLLDQQKQQRQQQQNKRLPSSLSLPSRFHPEEMQEMNKIREVAPRVHDIMQGHGYD